MNSNHRASGLDIADLLNAEMAVQESWTTTIPDWHPRNETVPPAEAPAADAAPPEGDQPQDEANELPFKLDEITDDFTLTGAEARQWLTTRQAQLQAPLTRRQQELAQEREQVAALAELRTKLQDPETSKDALLQLAKDAGVELEFEDEEPEPTPTYEDPLEREVAELRAWREAQEAKEQESQQAAQRTDAETRFNNHAVTEMSRIAEQLGTTLDDLPQHKKEDIVARALTAPTRPDGLPDFDAGLAAHLAYEEKVAEAARQAYIASKDVRNPGVSGGSGVKVSDLKSVSDRVRAGAKVADRHYSTS